jgi:hypothetical protein
MLGAVRARPLLAVFAVAMLTVAPLRATATSASPPTAIAFRASYTPGSIARVRVFADASTLTVQPISAAPAGRRLDADVPTDAPVAPARTVAWQPGYGTVHVRIGDWPSGVYFICIRTSAGTVVTPIVVRPARLGRAPVAVVIPTYSWEAYNWRDSDTWYACTCVHTVILNRPYLDSGVPYNFAQYDRYFLQWMALQHKNADFLSDQDLDAVHSGSELRRLYRLIIFEGHGEYVTSHIYDIVDQYRNLGGHLAFLSANGFFRDVTVSGQAMTLIGRWRDLGRPEAALIGSQYIDWYRNVYRSRPYTIVGARYVPWLFARTGLGNGSKIAGAFGIEIDGLAPSSPPGTVVVADIPNIFPGETAQMTYYTERGGAEVFNAGTINFGGNAWLPGVSALLVNLWRHMA